LSIKIKFKNLIFYSIVLKKALKFKMLYVVIAALAVFGSINADKVAFKDCGRIQKTCIF
jgi:hypothetical protein